ncbi:restriction endonuclease subunit S [Lagierella sp. ICN-221743]
MAEVRYIEVKLNKLFKNKRGNSNYTKKYCNANKGEYEVYTGTTIGSFGFINTYDYDEPLLTYTTDGENAATIKILSGKYNVGGHRAILFPKDENIVIDYFKWTLQKLFFDNVKKGDVPSITWSRIKDLEVTVPIDKNGNYDIEKQKEVVKKYEIVDEKKKELKEKLDYFKDVQVDFMATELSKSKKIKIKDIFDLSIASNASNFTKTFIKNNSGDIPVYGASKENEKPSYGYVVDNAIIKEKSNNKTQETKVKYFNDCLTYNIDGFAGYVFYRKGKFSLSEKVRPLIIKEEYRDFLNPEFLKFVIEPIFRNNRKGRLGEDEKNEYTKLYINMIEDIEINIPINKDGTFDLEKQNQIVSKYKAIEEMKKSILEKGLPFTLSNVQFDGETPYIYI